MPGSPAEVLNDDIKQFSRDLALFRETMRSDFADFRGEMRSDMKWIKTIGGATFAVFLLIAGGAGGIIWQASNIATRLGHVEQEFDVLNGELGRLKVRATTATSPVIRTADEPNLELSPLAIPKTP